MASGFSALNGHRGRCHAAFVDFVKCVESDLDDDDSCQYLNQIYMQCRYQAKKSTSTPDGGWEIKKYSTSDAPHFGAKNRDMLLERQNALFTVDSPAGIALDQEK